MKICHDTVQYYVEDAIDELKEIVRLCKAKNLDEGDFLPLLEHALEMLNCSYNCRHLNKRKIASMSQKEWENYLVPPKDIFK